MEIDWNGSGWLKGNAGQTGFYRVNYEQTQWDQLANEMNRNHKVLPFSTNMTLLLFRDTDTEATSTYNSFICNLSCNSNLPLRFSRLLIEQD